MANNATLKGQINASIKFNGLGDITGNLLNTILNAMVDTLGHDYTFAGIATEDGTPGTPDNNIFYLAVAAGTYTNYGGFTIDGTTLRIFTWNGSWSNLDTGVPTATGLSAALALKADKDANAVSGDVAIFDANGNPVDGGVALSGLAKVDGYYSQLVSGAAENIVGRSSVPASFLFRTTGGSADVGTGAAQIKELGGNGLVWNQLINSLSRPTATINGVTFTNNNDGTWTIDGTAGSGGAAYQITYSSFRQVNGHKYLSNISPVDVGVELSPSYHGGLSTATTKTSAVATCTQDGATQQMSLVIAEGTQVTSKKVYPMLIDLTKLFNGSVPEGYSVDDFKADFPRANYAYNAGEILTFAGQSLLTTGANLYNHATGKANLPQVDSAVGFKVQGTYTALSFLPYGETTPVTITPDANGQFTTSGAGELTITGGNNTDTMVYVYWSQKDLDFAAYEEHLFNVPISTMTGKVDGEGESVTIFGADGIVKAGSVSDVLQVDADGYARRVVKRIAKVDMGSLSWTKSLSIVYATIPGIKADGAVDNLLCSKYVATDNTAWNRQNTLDICHAPDGVLVSISDASLSAMTSAEIATALSGVMLYYELATPVEYVLDTPIFMGYYANDWGTECWGNKVGGAFVPSIEATEPYTAPSNYNVQYALNAADMLTNLVRNYMSINANGADESSMKALAGALSTALGIAISWTWDEATRKYTFAVADNRAFKVVAVPASASATGTAGNIAYDADYLYICVATDTWKRVAIATW